MRLLRRTYVVRFVRFSTSSSAVLACETLNLVKQTAVRLQLPPAQIKLRCKGIKLLS